MNDSSHYRRCRKFLRMLPIESLKVLIEPNVGEDYGSWLLTGHPRFKMKFLEWTESRGINVHKNLGLLDHIFQTLIHPQARPLVLEVLQEKVKAKLTKKAIK